MCVYLHEALCSGGAVAAAGDGQRDSCSGGQRGAANAQSGVQGARPAAARGPAHRVTLQGNNHQ